MDKYRDGLIEQLTFHHKDDKSFSKAHINIDNIVYEYEMSISPQLFRLGRRFGADDYFETYIERLMAIKENMTGAKCKVEFEDDQIIKVRPCDY